MFLLRESDHNFSNTTPYIVSMTSITQVIISLLELATPVNRTVKKKVFLKACATLLFTVLIESKGISGAYRDSLTFCKCSFFFQRNVGKS